MQDQTVSLSRGALAPSSPELLDQLRHDLALLTPLPPPERLDALLRDQDARWARGSRVPAEAYSTALPDLTDDDTLLHLISGELRLRAGLGDPLDPAEYHGRFPRFGETIARQIEIEAALNSEMMATSVRNAHITGTFVSGPGNITAGEADKWAQRVRPGLAASGANVPGFEVLGELGRGGMGVVYKACQVGLNRVVALKMVLPGTRSSSSTHDRFRKEAEHVARLEHPNIVPVFAFGEHEGQIFFALKYVPGGTLAQRLQGGQPWEPQRAADLVATLASAVEYAHRNGIIHRDLKPANILLDDAGTPFVTDFGLAREVEPSGLTLEGAAVGTPAYMAPEQATGDRASIGPHTDVFGLGAILFQLLTGRPPYQGSDLRTTLRLAEQGNVQPVREVNPNVPAELAAVVDRALAPDVKARYHTAGELERDLRKFLARTQRSQQRYPSLPVLTAVAAGLLGVVTTAILAVYVWNKGDTRHYATKPNGPSPNPEPGPALPPLTANFKIRFWSDTDPARRGRDITEAGVLPLHENDLIKFDLELNRRAYVYVLWIDGRGNIDPFYPWDRNDEKALFKPAPETKAVTRVMMPPEDDKGFPLEGDDGLETVLVMARESPLPADVKLGEVLGKVPPSPLRNLREVTYRGWRGEEEEKQLLVNVNRGPALVEKKIDEPVLNLIARVRKHFDVVRAVRFAYQKVPVRRGE